MNSIENELWVIEWNPKQVCFHVQELKRATETNLREFHEGLFEGRKKVSDFWVILAVVRGYTEASRCVDILRKMVLV